MEGALLLAAVAQRYRLALRPGTKIRAVPTSTLRPDQPILMQVSAVTAGATSGAGAV
jgi:hypothetical protein